MPNWLSVRLIITFMAFNFMWMIFRFQAFSFQEWLQKKLQKILSLFPLPQGLRAGRCLVSSSASLFFVASNIPCLCDCRFVLEGGRREGHIIENKGHHRSPQTNEPIISKAGDCDDLLPGPLVPLPVAEGLQMHVWFCGTQFRRHAAGLSTRS